MPIPLLAIGLLMLAGGGIGFGIGSVMGTQAAPPRTINIAEQGDIQVTPTEGSTVNSNPTGLGTDPLGSLANIVNIIPTLMIFGMMAKMMW
jgi:hypothetical protein